MPADTAAGEAAGAPGTAGGESGSAGTSAESTTDRASNGDAGAGDDPDGDLGADADLAAPAPTDPPPPSGTTVSESALSETVPLDPAAPNDAESTEDSPSAGGVATGADSGGRSGLGVVPWLIITAIVTAAIAAFLVITSSAERRPDPAPPGPNRLQRQLQDVIDGAHWIHDSGSVELLRSTTPQQARARWSEIRRLMVRIESRIATIAVGTGDPVLDQSLRHLGHCMVELRGAGESYVSANLRAAGATSRSQSDQLVHAANEAVMVRRQQLLEAIEPVAHTYRG